MKMISIERQTMKTNCFPKFLGGVLAVLLGAALNLHAQGRGGGGGGFGGGGGGFGGGGGAINIGGGGGGGARGGTGGSQAYNNNGTVGTANISVDQMSHNLVITADAKTMEQIRQVIANLDAPQRQVLIKVAFVEVDDNKVLNLGVEGNYTGFNNNFSKITGYVTNYTYYPGSTPTTPGTVGPSGLSAVSQSLTAQNSFGLPQTPTGAAGNGGIYTLMGNDFTATLQAVATAGKAQILSRPSILARDGQMAEIFVGQSVYLPSSVTLTSVGNSANTVPSINGNYSPVGILLDVTPFIGGNGLVQMILQPTIKSIDTSTPGQVIQGGSAGIAGVGATAPIFAPNINTRSANTVVVTPDGQPVAIGGLIGNNKASSETKIPLLGDIPILGNLFKFSSHANVKNELLIFLTPHIVQMPSELAAMSAHETSQASLITNNIPQKELDRFLDRLPIKKQ
jgi:general secretion pathway protein D